MKQKHKHEDSELTKYAQMGMAAMLPGMQLAVEIMQRNLDEFRAQLAGLQGKEQHVNQSRAGGNARAYWAKMTPLQRRNEMRRRGMQHSKAKAKPVKKTKLHWTQTPEGRKKMAAVARQRHTEQGGFKAA
jgi:hypothetical protein